MKAPYECKFCGSPSWVEPSDQPAPPDYCREGDHGAPEAKALADYDQIVRGIAPNQHILGVLADLSEIRAAIAAALRAAHAAGVAAEREALHIVFDGPPSHESGRFVECETSDGRSINAGEWHERPDGLWELRIPSAVQKTGV